MVERIEVSLPGWMCEFVASAPEFRNDADKMRFVIELSHRNVLERTGGPFGAAVFSKSSTLGGPSTLLAAGVNLVEASQNSCAHAEVVAIMLAEASLGTYAMRTAADAPCELVTSCDPCAMCLGAALWSGVRRIVCGAGREDAMSIGFDEGPVFEDSYRYLASKGIDVVRGFLRDEAAEVLRLYRSSEGTIYNG